MWNKLKTETVKTANEIVGHVDRAGPSFIMGWAIDKNSPSKSLDIAISLGNDIIALTKTRGTRSDLELLFGSDSTCVFSYSESPSRFVSSDLLSATVVSSSDALKISAALAARDKQIEYYTIDIDQRPRTDDFPRTKLSYAKTFLDTIQEKIAARAAFRDGPKKIFFEITDLIMYLRHHNTVTGIQRVECGVISGIFSLPEELKNNVEFGSISEDSSSIKIFKISDIQSLVMTVFRGNETVPQLIERIGRMLDDSIEIEPVEGDSVIILGAYWIIPDIENRLYSMKKLGVKIGTYVYDIIPISSPQWVENVTAIVFVERAPGVISLSDYLIAISEYVREDVRRLVKAELGIEKSVDVTPLPHSVEVDTHPEFNISPDLIKTVGNRYFLCVGTLEIRKNHFLLYRIWARLIREHGRESVPTLVLVGRWGWRMDDFKEACDRTNYLDGKIVMLSGINDAELKFLYRNCISTIFPSFTEGWGLPVGESLYLGKMCIASSTSSIPEVGGDFVDYIDPYDFNSSYEIVRNVIYNNEYRASREEKIRANFKSRSWADLAINLLNIIKKNIAVSQNEEFLASLFPPLLKESKIYNLLGLSKSDTISWGDKNIRFALAGGWHQLESWGAWSSASKSYIHFKSGVGHGCKLKVWLRLNLPNEYKGEEIRVVSGSLVTNFANGISNKRPKWYLVEAETDQDGCVWLSFQRPRYNCFVDGNRELYIGISGFVYCLSPDLAAANRILLKLLDEEI